ncbi:hypothetical protein QVD17_37961 [Tagetes erecta]|uniref:Uncharacterized protein n=1 Tax=Tagetes erecta TaxID=13708 RepID=A0AAD8JVN3_TARER|nr:hypothetical protein QVD17_37961 [Tagetes erecta]
MHISYVDGDEETLNLKTQRWEILPEFSVRDNEEQNTLAQSEEASPETNKKKKTKTDPAKSQERTKIQPRGVVYLIESFTQRRFAKGFGNQVVVSSMRMIFQPFLKGKYCSYYCGCYAFGIDKVMQILVNMFYVLCMFCVALIQHSGCVQVQNMVLLQRLSDH